MEKEPCKLLQVGSRGKIGDPGLGGWNRWPVPSHPRKQIDSKLPPAATFSGFVPVNVVFP